MMEDISFGKWLRQRRRMMDLSQQALADQATCARITLSRIEADTLKPSKELAGILLEKLGIPEPERSQWIRFARGLAGYPSETNITSKESKYDHPSGTVTLLFTDIEGSTKLARTHPKTWQSLLANHHAVLQKAIESNNGYVFQIIGDAFSASFHKAGDALEAALTAQQSLQNEDWGIVTVRVRMGIHTGEAELQDNGQYHGYRTLSLVQRIMSVGHGGQVLISGATENLLRGELPDGVELLDMGRHNLKDSPQAVHMFQMVAPNLQKDFPSLRTINMFPNNLPVQLASFVGREKELAEVGSLLQNNHMLTLIGPGGTGKTRLSIQVGCNVFNQFPDGVWLVEFAPILDPLLVPHTTASALGLRDDPQRPVIDMLCDYLRQKKMLIILDNCEHLVDACAQTADRIMHVSQDVRILASSREALGIAGEIPYSVPSLGLPDIDHLPSVESLSEFEAIKLFIHRATSAVPSFTVTNENAPALVQICHRLDGIPLAIELAAAKIHVLSVEQIARRLDDRFKLLTGGSRTVLERHQTLRAAVDWSYNLLHPEEQILFRRFSVFIGGWTLEAAESVCGDESTSSVLGSKDILDLLEQLIHKSLVIKEEKHGESRFHMLETIRQYAREKLVEAGQEGDIRTRHLAYFVQLAEQAEPELYRSNQLSWLNRLDDEIDNLRMALEWALATNIEAGLRIAAIPWRFWQRGYLRELGESLAQLLDRHHTFDSLHVQALLAYSYCNFYQGNFSETLKIAGQALQMARTLSDKQMEAFSFSVLGLFTLMIESAAGVPLLEQGLAIYRALGDKMGQAEALYWLSINNKDMESTIDLSRESLSLYRELGNLSGIASSLTVLARLTIWMGRDFSSPGPWLEEALSISRQLGEQAREAEILVAFGHLSLWQGDYLRAIAHFEEAILLSEKIGEHYQNLWGHVHRAHAVLRQGDIHQARGLFEDNIRITQKAGSMLAIVNTVEGVASLNANLNQPERAARLFAWTDATRESIGIHCHPVELDWIERDLVVIHSQIDDTEFTRLSAEGCTMTVEQAIALALEE